MTIAGGAKLLGGGLLALGAGGSAAAGALSLTTKALLVLKGLLIATPWGLAVAGLAALGKITFDYYKKQADLNRLLTDSSVKTSELKDAVNAKAAELEKASGKLDKLRESSLSSKRATEAQRKKVEELKRQLEALEGVYNVRIEIETLMKGEGSIFEGIKSGGFAKGDDGLTYTVAGVTYDARTGKPVVAKPQAITPPTGDDSSGGGAAPTDDLAGLQAQKQLLEQIAPLQEKINQAKLAGDQMLVTRLEGEKQRLELISQGEEAVRNMNTEEGKSLQAAINKLQIDQQSVEVQQQLAELKQQQAEAVQGVLQPLEDELELLQAKLNGNEDEIKQLQAIRDLKQQILSLDPNADTSGVEAMVKRRDALKAEVEQVEDLKQQYQQLASGIAGEMTGAFRSIIDGTKSVDEAFADMLKGIADKFLDMAMKILTDALTQQLMSLFTNLLSGFGGGGGGFGPTPLTSGMSFFADGGRPPLGEVSIVGERGPELFVPSSPGTVVSNEQSRAQLDMYSPGNAVDAPAGPMNVNMNYSGPTMAFDDKRYVPVEAIPGIIKDAAKQGEQRTLASMRNRVSTRNRVGI